MMDDHPDGPRDDAQPTGDRRRAHQALGISHEAVHDPLGTYALCTAVRVAGHAFSWSDKRTSIARLRGTPPRPERQKAPSIQKRNGLPVAVISSRAHESARRRPGYKARPARPLRTKPR
jgi:hypothetical protein